MKAQFTIIDPDLIADQGGSSILIGIAKTTESMDDYAVKIITLGARHGKARGVLVDTPDNLKSRSDSVGYSLHSMVTMPIWHRFETNGCVSGEITLLNIEAPGSNPDGLPHYLFFGLMNGKYAHLKAFSGRMIEADFTAAPDQQPARIAHFDLTGPLVTPERGNHLTKVIEQIIWGFGGEKYGMRFANSLSDSLNTFNALKEYIRTGEVTREMAQAGIHQDADYLAYLREIEKVSPLEFAQWENASQRQERERISARAIRQSTRMGDDFGPR